MAIGGSTVSVVLPCFNAEQTLGACLDSLVGQRFSDFEVVLFDDGSTDGTLEIAQGYASGDARVRVIESEHVGIVAGLRRACAEARGPLLARMDSDDVADGLRLEKQIGFMEAHRDVALCGTLVKQGGEGLGPGRIRYEDWVNGLTTHEELVRELFVECPIPHPTFVMRKEAYDGVGGYEERGWAEDYDLVMRFHLAGYRFGKVAEALLDWRHSAGRLSAVDARYGPERFRALKRHYLGKTYLAGRSSFYQWGAGEVGKWWLREWEGVKPSAVVDVNPRKIGRAIHGTQVIAAEELPAPGESFVVVAVGAPGARVEIREWFCSRGYVELTDFVFVA